MASDFADRLMRMAREGKTSADREWAAAKYREKFGALPEQSPAAGPVRGDFKPVNKAPEMIAAMTPAEALAAAKRDRIARETAVADVQEPTFTDKLKAALNPRELVNDVVAAGQGATDKFTLGLYPKLTDAIGLSTPESRAWYRQNSPNAAAIGESTGAAAGALAGPASLAGKAVTGTAQALAPRVASTALGRIGTGAATGGLLGYTETGDLHGAKEGALAGGVLSTAGELFGAGGRMIRNTRGGQARQLIESTGGEVGPLTSGKGGAIPEGVAPTKLNQQAIAKEKAADILSRMEAEAQTSPAAAEEVAKLRKLAGLPNKAPTLFPVEPSEGDVTKLASVLAAEEESAATAGLHNATHALKHGAEGLGHEYLSDRLTEMAAQSPQNATDIKTPAALRAKADLGFKVPPDLLKNATSAGALGTGAGYLLGSPQTGAVVGGGARVAADLLKANAPAITGRLLYSPAVQAELLAQALKSPQAAAAAPLMLRSPIDAVISRRKEKK